MRQRRPDPHGPHGPHRRDGRPRPRAGSKSQRPRFHAAARTDGTVILYGWHSVKAALENPARRIRRLWTTENAARRLADEGVRLPKAHEIVRPDAIAARLSPDAVHQGLLA